MRESDFFELVNLVLLENNRSAIDRTGSQLEIITVRDDDRVLQILAGPGSGKTEMIVWRVLYELIVRGTPSDRVMVTTFTKKAALELTIRVVERSDALLRHARQVGLVASDPRVHNLRIGTIHSLCDSLLAEFDEDYRTEGILLIDENETMVRMANHGRFELGDSQTIAPGRRLYDQLHQVDELVSLFRPPWYSPNQWPARQMQRVDFILSLLGHQSESWWPRCSGQPTPNGIETVHNIAGLTDELERAREGWRSYLDRHKILDFSSIQQVFRERQDTLTSCLDHVFVDEFQDTNPIQFEIHTRWLNSANIRLTVVGDDDQSVYRFRGSDIACFNELQPFCQINGFGYRRVDLEENHRSTEHIVNFSQAFKQATVLGDPTISMNKIVRIAQNAPLGSRPRLLVGPWQELCEVVASELQALRIGEFPTPALPAVPSAAMLMFSTSEKTGRPAETFRQVCERAPFNRRVYNPRNKTASDLGSPIVELFALLSYLIDPVTMAPLGANGRQVQVWATSSNAVYQSAAVSAPPIFNISVDHATIQKKFIKENGGRIGAPAPPRRPLFDYLDRIRQSLVNATANGQSPRLSINGLVSRLLSFDYFRLSGFTASMFRQAMFTQLMEANIAPTRLSTRSLDNAMTGVGLDANGKIVWPDQYWNFLNVFGGLLSNSDLDDEEVDVFRDHAISVLTFHQSKGLEFDHLYVAGTGRAPSPNSVLITHLFSGQTPQYSVANGQPLTTDQTVIRLAEADREREVYVAMTRAKTHLTFLHDPNHLRHEMRRNPGILQLFDAFPEIRHPQSPNVTVREWSHA